MIGELVVDIGKLVLRHVARSAVFRCDRTRPAWMGAVRFHRGT